MATEYARSLLGLKEPRAIGAPSPNSPGNENLLGSKRGSLDGQSRRLAINNRPDQSGPAAEGESKRYYPKSNFAHDFLTTSLKKHFLFSALSEAELSDMVRAMRSELKAPTENVIVQGETGDKFFVLEGGGAKVFVNGKEVTRYGPGAAFGELALMYNCPRAATVVATETTLLWWLDRRTFHRLLATTATSSMMSRCNFLKQVPLLAPLSNDQINKVATGMSTVQYSAGTRILRQGDDGDLFFIIAQGEVKITHKKNHLDPTEVEMMRMHAGDYFGEMALLLDEHRHANVIATTEVRCYTLTREMFNEIVGPLRQLLNQQMRIRVLRSVPLLNKMSDKQLDKIAASMRVQQFSEGDYIVRQGEEGNTFYIINDGIVRVTRTGPDGSETELIKLSNQEYFGEHALLTDEPRQANVIAAEEVECLILQRKAFLKLTKGLETEMAQEMQRRITLEEQAGVKHVEIATFGEAEAAAAAAAAVAAANEPPKPPPPLIPYERLRQIRTIGTGTFGRVKFVEDMGTHKVYALKCMQKAQIVSSHQERNIMNEKAIAAACKHPFLLDLVQTYNDRDRVYMLCELVQGGELWSLLYQHITLLPRNPKLPRGLLVDHARFYGACVVSAFKYLAAQGVAYRDLKPENIMISAEGYLKIVDFGFAKHIPYAVNGIRELQSFTLCGTPEYLSPELVLSKGHDKSVDYWAFGCLVYELLVGHTPFQDNSQSEIFRKVINSKKTLRFPSVFDADAKDLVLKLLNPNPSFRLGNRAAGVDEILVHPFFAAIDFSKLLRLELAAPYRPVIGNPLDDHNFDPYQENESVTPYTGPQEVFAGF